MQAYKVGSTNLRMIQSINEWLLIDPYYEGGEHKIGSIILPDSMTDVEAVQGVVVSAGERCRYLVGEYVFFHKGRSQFVNGGEFYAIREKDLVCRLDRKVGTLSLLPHRFDLLVLPDWDTKYAQPSKWVYLPMEALEHHQPCQWGELLQVSNPDLLPAMGLKIGDQIAYEPYKGSEIGYKDILYYVIPHTYITAKRIND